MDFYEILAIESGLNLKEERGYSSRLSKYVERCVNVVDVESDNGREKGRYVTLCGEDSVLENKEERKAMALCLKQEILSALGERQKLRVLIVGLGNAKLTADCLGAKTCDKIILFEGENEVYSKPIGVYAESGIESAMAVKGIAEVIMPDIIIAIDTLATNRPQRIGRVIQLTDSGITPGKGVDNARMALTRDELGAYVLAIGAPLVAYAKNVFENNGDYSDMHLVPKEIELLSEIFSDIIASGINMAFCNVNYKNSVKKGSSYTF